VTSAQDLSQIMDDHKTGDKVTVTFLRGQRKMSAQVTLEELGTQTA
jgi:S1-C subfamily serine protease